MPELFSPIPPSSDEVQQFTSGNMTGSIVWVFVSLALVIGLITLLIRWLSRRSQLLGGARALEQLGGLTLGPNKSVQVIEAAGRIYVVGVGENVTLLDSLPAGEEAEELRRKLLEKRSAASALPAAEWLRRIQGRTGKGSWPADSVPDEGKEETRRFQKLLEQKLEQQSKQQEELEQLFQETRDRDRLREE
jgi:flagellar protein FliO/FliZ